MTNPSNSRRGYLPAPHGSIAIEVTLPTAQNCGWLTYRGAAADLVSADCATSTMVARRKRGAPKPLDERGRRFWIDRYATKNQPERILIRRRIDRSNEALEMPGMLSLFPDGFPAPEVSKSSGGIPDTVEDWKARHKRLAVSSIGQFRDTNITGDEGLADVFGTRFRFDECALTRLSELISKFRDSLYATIDSAKVIDTERGSLAMRHGHLRLVVNNSSKAVSHG